MREQRVGAPEHGDVAGVDECLYALDEPNVMLPYAWCATASQARYRGWKELHDVGLIESVFRPLRTTAHVRYMRRFTDDAFAELTHEFCEKDADGAVKVWDVEVDE